MCLCALIKQIVCYITQLFPEEALICFIKNDREQIEICRDGII